MQRLVKNVIRVTFRFRDSEEFNTIDVVAKTHAHAFGEIISRYGSDVVDFKAEDLGARLAVVDDEDFYSIAKFKDPAESLKNEKEN